MNYEELYKHAMNGNADAMKTLNDIAGSGDAEAQYVLSCVYNNPDSPFLDAGFGMYWLKKSASYFYEPALRKLNELSDKVNEQEEVKTDDAKNATKAGPESSQSEGIWSFTGRIDRTTYIVYLVVYVFVFGIILYFIKQLPMENVTSDYGYYSYDSWQPTGLAQWADVIAKSVLAYLMLALGSKRLHDCGNSGWWTILVLVTSPLGPLYLLFKEGENTANEYGEVPE